MKLEPELTDEQKTAAHTLNESLSVLAGAGSGKTKVLVHHYIELLFKKGLNPTQIVAVTFTEKAANQLKSKIQETLLNLQYQNPLAKIPSPWRGEGQGGGDAECTQDHPPSNSLPSREGGDVGTEYDPIKIDFFLEQIPTAPISTLHGLAARIVRDASLLIGIEPNFKILNPAKVTSLKFDAISQTISELLSEKSDSIQILLSQYGWSKLQNQLFLMLENWPAWNSIPLNPFDTKMSSLQRQGSPASTRGIPAQKPAGMTDPLDQEKKNWTALRSIFQKTLIHFETMKKNQEGFDFNDLEEKAIELLTKHPYVKKHYHRLWNAFLVDEFQDTNPRQERLLSLLLGIDLEAEQIPADRHLAIVGDAKQSIYAFREANPDIFKKFKLLIEKNQGKTVHLTHNFRSSRSLVEWINEVSSPLFEDYQPLKANLEDPVEPVLEVLKNPTTEKPLLANERRELEAKLLAKRIVSLLNEKISPQKIFLLFRSSSAIPIYLKIFKQENIPLFVKSTENLFEQQEVLDLIHAIRAVVDPQNRLAWAGLLRSPLIGISDEALLEKVLSSKSKNLDWFDLHPFTQKISKKRIETSPFQFLNWIIEESEIISLYNSIEGLSYKSENILQFLHFADEWEKNHSGDLKDFLLYLDELISRRIRFDPLSDQLSGNESVTFMTIHQAKGLDLPIVILPDLYNSLKETSVPIADFFEGRIGFRLPLESRGLKQNFEDSESLQSILEKKRELFLKEEDRIFYVAITRAVEKIILGFIPPVENKKKQNLLYQEELFRSIHSRKGIHWISEESFQSSLSQREIKESFQSLKPIGRKTNNHFAVTQLESYLRSPEEYRDRYIYQIPADLPLTPSFVKRGENYSPLSLQRRGAGGEVNPLEKGKLIHEALCQFSHSKKDLEKIVQTLLIRHSLILEEKESSNLLKTLQQTVEHLNFQPVLNSLEGYSEIPFLLSLPPYEIRGSMDRLFRDEEEWKIIDYKTHRPKENEKPEEMSEAYRFQMKTYALAATKMIGKPVLKTVLYFVIPNSTYSFEFSEKEILSHEKYLIDLMDEINKKS